jgi:hypothetical protein
LTFPITLINLLSHLNQYWDKKLSELTMFLAKSHFCLFHAGNKGNKLGGKYHTSFYEKGVI